ncbi:MAG TPA: viroplasmin family protein [Candidatus Paceibacterota bacterium]|nr:viroplasmin family protein [Candidatus Paceibacterota bacterium]
MAAKKNFYAYLVPRGPRGIASSWAECEKLVKGKADARYRGFAAKSEAEEWLRKGAVYEAKPARERRSVAPEPGVYFDSGTGRGKGVEISVTDEKGIDLLRKVIPRKEVNRFGKQFVKGAAATNNYGELLALRRALEIAKKTGMKKIFGDSRLVIDYWSKWRMKRKELPEATVTLAREVSAMREEFEEGGGDILRIPGGRNPADLGFHS